MRSSIVTKIIRRTGRSEGVECESADMRQIVADHDGGSSTRSNHRPATSIVQGSDRTVLGWLEGQPSALEPVD